MRTKDDLFALERLMDKIKTLLLYLEMNPNEYVERPFGLMHERISRRDGNNILTVRYSDDIGEIEEIGVFDPTINRLYSFVVAAKESAPSEQYKDTFESRWDEIEKVTQLNMGFNRAEGLQKCLGNTWNHGTDTTAQDWEIAE